MHRAGLDERKGKSLRNQFGCGSAFGDFSSKFWPAVGPISGIDLDRATHRSVRSGILAFSADARASSK